MKMLPQGIYPISKIEKESTADTQVTKLVSLLGYLLSLINPKLTPKDGKNVGFGERVNANIRLFTNPPDIFFAIGVRNCIVHPENCEKSYTEGEIKRAAKHLLNAIYEIRDHKLIPADVKRDVFRPATSRVGRPISQTPRKPKSPRKKPAKSRNIKQNQKSVVARSAKWLRSLRSRHPGSWVAALIVGAFSWFRGKRSGSLSRSSSSGQGLRSPSRAKTPPRPSSGYSNSTSGKDSRKKSSKRTRNGEN